jgi:type II secretory pathway pseudopilin PulG
MFDQFFDCSFLEHRKQLAPQRPRRSSVSSRVFRNENGFSMIEAMAALGLSGAVIASCMFLAGEGSKQVNKRIQGSKSYLALQNLSEQLLVSNGSGGTLTEGDHGPIYYDANGRTAASGPVSVTWHVTANDPSPNIIKIQTVASWSAGSQSADLVIYRSSPVIGTPEITEIVPLPSPTSTPAPLPTYTWKYNVTLCGDPAPLTKQIYYLCKSSLGVFVADSFCAPPKPGSFTRACTMVTYGWVAGPWEQNCIGGTHGRSVNCIATPGGEVSPESDCDPSTKPAQTEACAECYPYCA